MANQDKILEQLSKNLVKAISSPDSEHDKISKQMEKEKLKQEKMIKKLTENLENKKAKAASQIEKLNEKLENKKAKANSQIENLTAKMEFQKSLGSNRIENLNKKLEDREIAKSSKLEAMRTLLDNPSDPEAMHALLNNPLVEKEPKSTKSLGILEGFLSKTIDELKDPRYDDNLRESAKKALYFVQRFKKDPKGIELPKTLDGFLNMDTDEIKDPELREDFEQVMQIVRYFEYDKCEGTLNSREIRTRDGKILSPVESIYETVNNNHSGFFDDEAIYSMKKSIEEQRMSYYYRDKDRPLISAKGRDEYGIQYSYNELTSWQRDKLNCFFNPHPDSSKNLLPSDHDEKLHQLMEKAQDKHLFDHKNNISYHHPTSPPPETLEKLYDKLKGKLNDYAPPRREVRDQYGEFLPPAFWVFDNPNKKASDYTEDEIYYMKENYRNNSISLSSKNLSPFDHDEKLHQLDQKRNTPGNTEYEKLFEELFK